MHTQKELCLKVLVIEKGKVQLRLGDNTIISNIAISFFIRLRYREPFQVIEISENCDYKNISRLKKNAIVSQVRNYMEMKLGQSFQLPEVTNNS